MPRRNLRDRLRYWWWRLRPDQYGPEGVRCRACRRRTYGDALARYCVHCGALRPAKNGKR